MNTSSGKGRIEATELEYWAALGRLERVAKALEKNPDIDQRGEGGYTALHGAVENEHLEVIRFLAERGADLNLRLDSGETPLALAERYGKRASSELLRSLGAK